MTESSGADAVPEPTTVDPIAPAWHTAVLLLYLAGLSISSAIFHKQGLLQRAGVPEEPARLLNYAVGIAQAWLAVAYVWWGIRRRGVRIATLVGGRWATVGDVLRDLGYGFLALLGMWFAAVILSLVLHVPRALGAIERLLPHSVLDLVLWCFVSTSAGICEEILCRGYLQRQFTAWTKSAWGAVVLQALIFGFAHGYQGVPRMIVLVFIGLVLGIVALRRQSLRPGMIAHSVQDTFAGFTYYVVRKMRM